MENKLKEFGKIVGNQMVKEAKQKESKETWDEIFELYNYSLSTIKDSSPYKLKNWLKEHYSPPQKR